MDKYLPFVTIDVWTMIFTWCNLLILFLLMKKLFFRPISDILKKRKEEIDQIYDDAEKSNQSAKALESEYSEKLSHAKSEAAGIIDNAVKNASVRSDDIINEANEKAASMIERANKQIEQSKQESMNDIKSNISNISIAVAEKLIERDMSDEDHKRIVDEIIDEMGDKV